MTSTRNISCAYPMRKRRVRDAAVDDINASKFGGTASAVGLQTSPLPFGSPIRRSRTSAARSPSTNGLDINRRRSPRISQRRSPGIALASRPPLSRATQTRNQESEITWDCGRGNRPSPSLSDGRDISKTVSDIVQKLVPADDCGNDSRLLALWTRGAKTSETPKKCKPTTVTNMASTSKSTNKVKAQIVLHEMLQHFENVKENPICRETKEVHAQVGQSTQSTSRVSLPLVDEEFNWDDDDDDDLFREDVIPETQEIQCSGTTQPTQPMTHPRSIQESQAIKNSQATTPGTFLPSTTTREDRPTTSVDYEEQRLVTSSISGGVSSKKSVGFGAIDFAVSQPQPAIHGVPKNCNHRGLDAKTRGLAIASKAASSLTGIGDCKYDSARLNPAQSRPTPLMPSPSDVHQRNPGSGPSCTVTNPGVERQAQQTVGMAVSAAVAVSTSTVSVPVVPKKRFQFKALLGPSNVDGLRDRSNSTSNVTMSSAPKLEISAITKTSSAPMTNGIGSEVGRPAQAIVARDDNDSAMWSDDDCMFNGLFESMDGTSGKSGNNEGTNSTVRIAGSSSDQGANSELSIWGEDADIAWMDIDIPLQEEKKTTASSSAVLCGQSPHLSSAGERGISLGHLPSVSNVGRPLGGATELDRPLVSARSDGKVAARKREASADDWTVAELEMMEPWQPQGLKCFSSAGSSRAKTLGPGTSSQSAPSSGLCSPEEIQRKKLLALEKRLKVASNSQPKTK